MTRRDGVRERGREGERESERWGELISAWSLTLKWLYMNNPG